MPNISPLTKPAVGSVEAAVKSVTTQVLTQYGTTTDQIKAEHELRKQRMADLQSKLNSIEEKSSCGGVMFLDKVADFLELCSKNLHLLSLRVRNRTTRMSAPCSITFKKK